MVELTIQEALQQGIVAHKAGQFQEADRLYNAVLSAHPNHPDASHNIGVLTVSVGKVEQALPFFKAALEANPRIPQFWLSYIDALIKLDHFASARSALDKAKGMGFKGVGFNQVETILDTGDKAALGGAAKYINVPSEEIQSLIHLYNEGQFVTVIDKTRALTNIYPKAFTLWNILGAANKKIGKTVDALQAFKKSTQLNPNYAEGYKNLGITFEENDQYLEAIKAYSKAIEIMPNYAEAHNNMGNALQAQGKFNEAIQSYRKTLEIKPDYVDAHNNIGNAFKALDRKKEALDAYHKALAIDPGYAAAYNNVGNILSSQNQSEEAVEAYNKAIQTNPDFSEAYNNLGNALKDQGKLQEAMEAYNRALIIEPVFAEAYNNIGIVLKEKGKISAAIKAYNKALAIRSDFSEANYNKGNALYDQGNFQEAIDAYKKSSFGTWQTSILKCLYKLDNLEKFTNQLDHLTEQGEYNAVIGSLISRAQIKYGLSIVNPFCNEPLKYVSHTNLKVHCDFDEIFIKGANKILTDEKVQKRSQDLLINGFQTTGNVFSQVGGAVDKIKSILHAEIEKYLLHFKGSDEGFIKNWPLNYDINGWLISMKSGGALAAHIHDNGWLSGSIYINVPPKATPEAGNLVVCLDSKKNSHSINVVTGSLCLFPASLRHYTLPFEAKENRTVLAFDVIPL